ILLPSLRKLTTDVRFKSDLGDSNIESLNLLLTNIKDRFDFYVYNTDKGNDEEARRERKEVILIGGRIVKKMESILESLSLKGKNADMSINKESNSKLNYIVEELSLKEDDWDNLIYYIKEQQCVPFVGADTWSSKGVLSNLSEDWTALYDYPFEDSSQLSRVAQFIAIDKGDPMYPKRALSKMLREIKPPDFSKVKDSPYLTLSSLNLPIYITTNYDHTLEEALRFHKKNPQSEVCRWFDDLKTYLDNANKRSILKSSKYQPSRDEPLVYHLHGDMDIPQSMVLTERDYIQFVINLSKEKEKYIFPPILRAALATSSLLFIGYSLEELNFRIIFQAVLGLQVGDLRETSISVQLPPRLSQNKQKKALKYLREYIKDQKVYVYWGNSESFCNDLSKRLSLVPSQALRL
ncbi:MAG TPA: SIR2 family protein, partial [Nitrososphaeraceae archaeon]|nr:SIR2 family protein [Nitrososphaeraceae archaeon]